MSSGGPPVQWSGTIYAIFKEGIMGNIHVKLYEIWTSGSGDVPKGKTVKIFLKNKIVLQRKNVPTGHNRLRTDEPKT